MQRPTQDQLSQLADLISKDMKDNHFLQQGTNMNEVVESLITTQSSFCPSLSLENIWEQEKAYYLEHGMSSFDCGYAGKKLRPKRATQGLTREEADGISPDC